MARFWKKRKDVSVARRLDRALSAAVVEALDRRVMLAVTASLAGGELRVTGDDADNVIVVSRTVAGAILVNNGAVPIVGGVATVANTNHLHIVGVGGNDQLSLDETNGPLPGAALFGGAGNDTLTGGSGVDFVDGETGSDVAFLGAGDDTFGWNSGDGSDVVDGQAGSDTVVFNGSDLAEKFGIADSGAGTPFHRVRLTRDVGNVTLDLGTVEDVDVNTLGGTDTVTIDDQTATDLFTVNLDLEGTAGTGDGDVDAIVINGSNGDDVAQVQSFGNRIEANAGLFPFVNVIGAEGKESAAKDTLTINTLGGNDTVDAAGLAANAIALTINSGAGNDEVFGSVGNDSVIGGAGNDSVVLDAGDDTFVWNAGDGNDVVDGQGGIDTLIFNGANSAENIAVSRNGTRVGLTDDVGNVSLDFDGVEQLSVSPLAGADRIGVNDVAGTALTIVKVKLGPDGQFDSVAVNGTNADDAIIVDGDFANGVRVTGLAAEVDVLGAIGVGEGLIVDGRGGVDAINASTLEAGAISLTINGGDGNDRLTGSQGDDVFVWNPGDGSDSIEGQGGHDTLAFNGADTFENITLSANAGQLRLTRAAGGVVIDANDVERVNVNTQHPEDTFTINDLSGTDVTGVNLNVDPTPGVSVGGGIPVDVVTINGSATATDNIAVLPSAGGYTVAGLAALITVTGADTPDLLRLNTFGGADVVDASAIPAGIVLIAIDGGAGNDTLRGSQGSDLIAGREGDDDVFLGGGDDTFFWNAGDGNDTVEGQAGRDAVIFNGSDLAENFAISASGNGARATRNIDAVTIDFDDVERVDVNAGGGADSVTVNDLSGTDVNEINVDLGAMPGSNVGDGQGDSIVVNGSNASELIPVLGTAGGLLVNGAFLNTPGLPYFMAVRAVEASDSLRINGNGGGDTIEANLDTPVMLTFDGGAQTDTINVVNTAANGVVNVLASGGDDAVNVNADGVGTARVSFSSTQRIGALTIGNGGVASVTAGGANVLTATSLGIAATGRLNLNNNQLVVDYAPGAASPIAGIRALLTSGYHNGAWDGNGIMSGLADASKFALGFAEASDVGGLGLDGTAVVVKFTLYGDANLDGGVDFLDLARLAQSYNTTVPVATTPGSWSRGDFSFDGAVDFLDLAKLAQQYNTSLPGAAAGVVSAAPSTAAAVATTPVPVAGTLARRPVRWHDRHARR